MINLNMFPDIWLIMRGVMARKFKMGNSSYAKTELSDWNQSQLSSNFKPLNKFELFQLKTVYDLLFTMWA